MLCCWNLYLGAGFLAFELGFGSMGWDLGLGARICVLGRNLDHRAGIWGLRALRLGLGPFGWI